MLGAAAYAQHSSRMPTGDAQGHLSTWTEIIAATFEVHALVDVSFLRRLIVEDRSPSE
jgi:hypothetical protein